MTSKYISSLDEAQLGCLVVVELHGWYYQDDSFRFKYVSRLTDKQIIVGDDRYWRKDGKQVGGSSEIHAPGEAWSPAGGITYADKAKHCDAIVNAKDRIDRLSNSLAALRGSRRLNGMSIEALEGLYRKLDDLFQALQ